MDDRIEQYFRAVQQLAAGHHPVDLPAGPADEIGRLGQALQELARSLETRRQEQLEAVNENRRLASELSRLGEHLEDQNEELRRLKYLKNVFLGKVVHDLRNPIANLQLAADVLLDTTSPSLTEEEKLEFIKDIHQQMRYMALLVNDILNVAEIEGGRPNLAYSDLDLAEILRESVQGHEPLASARGAHIFLECAPGAIVRADARRLRQALDHLVSNAIQSSPQGGTIRVRAAPQPGAWRVEVQDEGPGITEKDRSRLFQDFARFSARPTGGEKSTGLGLAFARRVIEAHGGQIGVDSQAGQGATFWFTLPSG